MERERSTKVGLDHASEKSIKDRTMKGKRKRERKKKV